MRGLIILTGFLGAMIYSGCDNDLSLKSTLLLNDTTEIANFETKFNFEQNLSLRMDSVLNDSRCPSNVVCVWEGNAEVRFLLRVDSVQTDFTLNTHGSGRFNSDTLIGGYKIKLLSLSPYPEDPVSIEQVVYRSAVMVFDR